MGLGGHNGLQIGRSEHRKDAILGEKSARVRFRVGFAGYPVRGRACPYLVLDA